MPEESDKKTYKGSCHCQAVQFEIDTNFPELTTCNCSICRRKNALMVKVHETEIRILDGEESIKMFGYDIPVRCHVEKIEGLSAHADRTELLNWLGHFKGHPKNTFVVHGELKSSESFATTVRAKFGWNVTVPKYKETIELFRGI